MTDTFALSLSATALLPAIYGAFLPNVATVADDDDTPGARRAHISAGVAGLVLAVAVGTVDRRAGLFLAVENLIMYEVYAFARQSR